MSKAATARPFAAVRCAALLLALTPLAACDSGEDAIDAKLAAAEAAADRAEAAQRAAEKAAAKAGARMTTGTFADDEELGAFDPSADEFVGDEGSSSMDDSPPLPPPGEIVRPGIPGQSF